MSGKERVLSVKEEQRRETASNSTQVFGSGSSSNRSRGTTSVQQFVLALYSGLTKEDPGSAERGWIRAWKQDEHESTAGCWEELRSVEPGRQSEVNAA